MRLRKIFCAVLGVLILGVVIFVAAHRFDTSSHSDHASKNGTSPIELRPSARGEDRPETMPNVDSDPVMDRNSALVVVSHVRSNQVPSPVSVWLEDVFRYERPNAVIDEIVKFDGSSLTPGTDSVRLTLDEKTTIVATRNSGRSLATGGIKWIGRIDDDGGTVNIEMDLGQAVIRITPLGQRRYIRPTPYHPYHVLYKHQIDERGENDDN